MSASNRVGVVVALVLVAWVVIYYRIIADVASPAVASGDNGLALEATDTVGANPTEDAGNGPIEEGANAAVAAEEESDGEEGAASGVSNDAAPSLGSNDAVDSPVTEDEVPVDEDAGPGLPPPPPTTPYVVQSGDTMQTIAVAWFGDKAKWVLIAHENPYVDPQFMRAGQTIRLPAKDARLETIPLDELKRMTEGVKYVVVSGDSLWRIAERHYGNGSLSSLVFDANRNVLRSESDLQIGMELTLPPYQRPAE